MDPPNAEESADEYEWDLDRLVERSKRSTGVRLPSAFARGGRHEAVLPRLIQGGRGGGVRLKLYLSMVLLGGSRRAHHVHGPNTIVDVSGPTWARALGLRDPAGSGARRVADAQNRLADLSLVRVERVAGRPPKLVLLNATASGEPWTDPGTPYIRVPLEVWTNRWIWALGAKELAVLIAILDLCSGTGRDRKGGPQALSGTPLGGYGMSADTWRLASASLTNHGLIRTERVVARTGLESARLRKRYELLGAGLARMAPLARGS